jgi:hypothetical protein
MRQFQEGFVDDISNYANNEFEDQCIKNLHAALQSDGQKWVGLLEGTGGKLELTKCFYYMLSWGFDKNGSPYPHPIKDQPPGLDKLNMRGDHKEPQYILQKEVTESHKTLGVFKTFSGTEEDHVTSLKTKSDNIITRLWSGQINRRQDKLAYNCNYIPAMVYSLPATRLTENNFTE